MPSYSRFTTRSLTSFPSTSSETTSLHRPSIHCFASPHTTPCLSFDLAIIDLSHPPPEPPNLPSSLLFDGWFGIPFLDGESITHVRSPQPTEILELYRLPSLVPLSLLLSHDILRSFILHSPPLHLASHISSVIIHDISFPSSTISEPSHLPIGYCFSLRPLPQSSDLTAAYLLDSETKIILESLQSKTELSGDSLANLCTTYRQTLANDLVNLFDGKLVYYEQTSTSTKYICRIIVPSNLRRYIFSVLHAFPSAGHMGEYKTLYRVKLRYFSPRHRRDIKDWIKSCPYCTITYKWHRRGSELLFYWPVSAPFTIYM